MLAATAFALLALVSSAIADPAPLTPVGSKEGEDCIISWTADTTGNWTETNVQLMTGDNFQMKHITTVAKINTSSGPTTYSYPCPLVNPNSLIYFYQFSTPTAPTKLVWSTRFSIAGPNGELTPPEFATQPDANKTQVGWGIGGLENPSLATPPPSYITGQGVVTGTPSSVNATSTSSRITSTSSTSTTSTSRTASAAATTSASASGALSQIQSSLGLFALGAISASIFGML